jgi:hypothetical protein
MRAGDSDSISARIIGTSKWCTALPDDTTIELGWRKAVSTLGRERVIPIDQLAPADLHPPRTKPALEKMPRNYWVLDLVGPGGTGSIAARLEDLALLGAIAGWEPPQALMELDERT